MQICYVKLYNGTLRHIRGSENDTDRTDEVLTTIAGGII